jgi:hypothetical protein
MILFEDLKERDQMDNNDIDGGIILKWIYKKQYVRV